MSRVVTCARHWIGTPYVHQQSVRGAGCDCLGLVRGVWRDLLGAEPAQVPPYSMDWGEASGHEILLDAAQRHLTSRPLGQPAPGDVLLFRMRAGAVAKHLGIQAQIGAYPTFIHAYSGRAVVETALTPGWSRRLVARFAFPKEI